MALSISKTKNKGGRPRTDATPVMVRLPPDLLAALDAHMAEDGRNASRPDWIRQALREWLADKGRFNGRDDDESAS